MSKRKSNLTDYDIAQAKVARTINWKVVENWRQKLGAGSNFEMVADYDSGYYFQHRMLNFGPFHRHVRINLDKMLWTGCYTFDDAWNLLKEFKEKGGSLKALVKSEDDENFEESDD